MRGFGGRLKNDWMLLVPATAPDLDILVGVLRERPVDYSNRRSHSLGAAVAAGLIMGGWARLLGRRFLPGAVMGTAAYASHLALDYMGKEAEDGIPLLWPLSHRRISTDRPIFRTIHSRRDNFFRGLITRRNLRRVGRELAILSPVVLVGVLTGRLLDARASS